MLFGMLPVLEGWIYDYMTDQGEITVGQSRKKIYDIRGRGMVMYASLEVRDSLDAKYTTFYIEIDGPGRPFVIQADLEDLYRNGYTSALPFGFILTRYDDDEKIYSMVSTFNTPMPFAKRVRAYIAPPASAIEEPTPTSIEYFTRLGIVSIYDLELFREMEEI